MTSIPIVNLQGSREALPKKKNVGKYKVYAIDKLDLVHLEVDVEAMAKINLNILKSESLKNRNPYILPEHEYSEFCSCWGCKLSAVIAESNANKLLKWARLVRK